MRRLESFRQDLAVAFRAMRRERGFALTAIVILARGIGAQAAVFSLVNGILLRPMLYNDSGRLYALQEVIPQLSHLYPVLPVNARHYIEWTRHCSSCVSIALMNTDYSGVNLAGAGEPERISGEKVTPNYCSLLGVGPARGRTIEAEDGQAGRDNVVVISDALWKRKFGGDSSIIGRSITLNDTPFTVVGVLPPWFRAPAWPSLGIPMEAAVDVFQPWALKESDWDMMGGSTSAPWSG